KKFFKDLLLDTIFRVTKKLNKKWCIAVFEDNSGIIEFDKNYAICAKVETHNHPSAIEPYGGAATGLGGVIRDIIATGLGAEPVASIDAFCFSLKDGIFPYKRIFKGVISGVRDYGNRVGIPIVSGAIYFDDGYRFNLLVFCGCVGIIPKDKCFKEIKTGDLIIVVGGKTGRDGIHGATFSSNSLHRGIKTSVVQIGDPLTEKKLIDAILKARDLKLFNAITDCGAGGLSTAIPELAKNLGVKVYLDKLPLKHLDLKPWEIWVSESQERMILVTKKTKLKRLLRLFSDLGIEASVIGNFTNSKKIEVYYKNMRLTDLDNYFVLNPPMSIKKAIWRPKKLAEPFIKEKNDYSEVICKLLSQPNIASKECVIRQYDFEVKGNTVLKPISGKNAGPSDGVVLWLSRSKNKFKGLSIGLGLNPQYGKIDPYYMAASVIDEAIRNVVASGANISKIALLDNFSWGKVTDEEKLGEVVRAVKGCYEIAKAYSTPFISGKDSLNNVYKISKFEFSIPGTLLITAIAVIDDIRKTVSTDFKEENNLICIVGTTYNELGGSEYYKIYGYLGKNVPKLHPKKAKKIMQAVWKAIDLGIIKSCHDCSQGGFAIALAEMCIASGFGAVVELNKVPYNGMKHRNDNILFSESNSRFIVEISPNDIDKFAKIMHGCTYSVIGKVIKNPRFTVYGLNNKVIADLSVEDMSKYWKCSLSW
ncbi:MAG: phosphoribosylformylglycinamidine synthase subunit PurL, partial [bacterium]|nr:phosphoribosylformylglycinamidine synthase subunit PurL [bacterium]